jgi:Domain of unknown function (DUF4136)
MGTRAFLAAATIVLSACATSPDVQTTVEPGVDPGQYRTYTFVQSDPKAKGAITDSVAQRRLQQMVSSQLLGKGYAQASPGQEAQLGVHITGHVVPKQRVFVTGRPGPYDYNWGRVELGGYETVDYREGTLFVDVVDLAQGRLAWRTRISEALTAGYSEENWSRVERALAEAFRRFPPRR